MTWDLPAGMKGIDMSSDFSHTILCVDDEKNIINSLKRLLRKENYRILSATNGMDGLAILAENNVQLVICDQRMAEMSGVEFLEKVHDLYPDTIRITLTGYTEVDTITESINRGAIHKFFLKPWNDDILKLEVKKALERYDLMEHNRQLQERIFQQNEELKAMNDTLEHKVRERTRQLEIRNQALELSRVLLDELPMGVIGISQEKIIALVNNSSARLRIREQVIELGQKVSDCFPPEIVAMVDTAIAGNSAQEMNDYHIGSRLYQIRMLPLSGKFAGNGFLMTIDCTSSYPNAPGETVGQPVENE